MVLYVVGTGPEDREYITLKALNTIARCSIVFGWRRTLERFRELLEGRRVFEIGSEDVYSSIESVVRSAARDDVALLLRGDPCVAEANLMRMVRELCSRYGVRYSVVSGVSSLNIALARVGIDIAEAVVVSMHSSRDVERELDSLKQFIRLGRYVVLYPKPSGKWVREIAGRILRSIECDARVHLLQRLSFENEITVVETLSKLASGEQQIDSYTIIVIEPCSHGG